MNVKRLLLVHSVMLFIAFISIITLTFFQGAAIKDYESMKHCYQPVNNIPCKIPSLKEYKPYCIYLPAITNKSNGTENPIIDTYTINNRTFENDFAHYSKQYTLLRVEFLRRITEKCGDDSVAEQLKEGNKLQKFIEFFDKIQICYQKLQKCQHALVYSKHINSAKYELGSLSANFFNGQNLDLYWTIYEYVFGHVTAKTLALKTIIDAMLYTIFNLSNMCMSYDQKLRNENEKNEQYINLDLSVYHILNQLGLYASDSPETTARYLKDGNHDKKKIIDTLHTLMQDRYKFELKLKNE